MNKVKYNFGWGNPYFLLDILSDMYVQGQYHTDLKKLIYGPYEGIPMLIEETHKVIAQTTGQKYNHILITNGASSAVNCLLRRFKRGGGQIVYTTKYGYPSYEEMIKRAGLRRINNLQIAPFTLGTGDHLFIRLIDSPENPMGQQYTGGNPATDIWDGVYHNKIYTQKAHLQPQHKYFVGSYSKLLGVAGARVGFIATNDTLAYEALLAEARNELTGVSRPSQELIVNILKTIDLNTFMTRGLGSLCYNKEEFQKIEYLFDGQPVNEVGMFYCAEADPKAVDILDRAGVEYVRLDDRTIRLSMGQSRSVVKDGIKAILKEDGK